MHTYTLLIRMSDGLVRAIDIVIIADKIVVPGSVCRLLLALCPRCIEIVYPHYRSEIRCNAEIL